MSDWMILLTIGETIWVVALSVWIILERRSPAATLAWIFALAFVPLLGIGSPNTASPWRCSAATSSALRASGFHACASSRRRTSTVMPGKVAAASAITRRMSASTCAGSSSGIMRRSSRSTTLPGTTLVFVPPSMRPTLRYGCVMPGTFDVTPW